MIDFRPVRPMEDRDFVQEMFLLLAYEAASEAERRPGLNKFRIHWLTSPEARTTFKAMKSSLADPRTIADIVLVNGVQAGFVWATLEGQPHAEKYYELRHVAFKIEFQRQGLGRVAVHHVEELARERGVTAIRATGSANLESIRRFHASLGFQPVQTIYEKRLVTEQ